MIIELIRKQIEKCGKTRYRISQESGISEAQLCRIIKGKTCTVETADVLLEYFGLELVPKEPKKKTKRG
jgi:plasmid maintenance system antidote protein VapI